MKDHLFQAFYQGKDRESEGAGNCASIAIIKASMYAFGYDVFSMRKNADVYNITLKNGTILEFNEQELAYASKEASFILGEPLNENERVIFEEIREYAYLCFTAICKMAQKNGDYSSELNAFIVPEDFETAVEVINDGTFTPEVYEFLGLESFVSPTYRLKLSSRIDDDCGMVVWTGFHAMYANKGYFDLYGSKKKFNSRVMVNVPGRFATGLFQVIP